MDLSFTLCPSVQRVPGATQHCYTINRWSEQNWTLKEIKVRASYHWYWLTQTQSIVHFSGQLEKYLIVNHYVVWKLNPSVSTLSVFDAITKTREFWIWINFIHVLKCEFNPVTRSQKLPYWFFIRVNAYNWDFKLLLSRTQKPFGLYCNCKQVKYRWAPILNWCNAPFKYSIYDENITFRKSK